MPNIHPTAIVDSGAKLAEDVEVGAYCVVESDVTIGAGTVLKAHAVIRRYTTLGQDNYVDSFSVLGGEPQDLSFDRNARSFLTIGDHNTFREGVTISRATKPSGATTVGNETFWMANSHAGHDTRIGNNVVIVNGVLLAGHATVGDKVVLSGNTLVHQFTSIGEMVMSQGMAGMSMHVPPYVMLANTNQVIGLNHVGLRRDASLTSADRSQIKQAFSITYMRGLSPAEALVEMDACREWGPPAAKFRDFVRKVLGASKPYIRGLCPLRRP